MMVVEAPVGIAETPNSALAPSSAFRFAHRTVKANHAVGMDVEGAVVPVMRAPYALKEHAWKRPAQTEMHATWIKVQRNAWHREHLG